MLDTFKKVSLEYRNFMPRQGMEPVATLFLANTVSDISNQAAVKAVITDLGDRFLFSIGIGVKRSFFSVEAVLFKRETKNNHRLWQLYQLQVLVTQVLKQISFSQK